jgi:pyruvate formate lyase activating enzyme
LIPANKKTDFSWDKIMQFIRSRQGLLDAVVFSGGEPCLQSGLFEAMSEVKSLGFKIGLHTGGAYPHQFEQCLSLVDWVGFDIKHLPLHYELVTQTPKSAEKAWQSLQILLDSKVEFQLRITKHPDLISDQQLAQLKSLISQKYHQELTVQECNTRQCLDEELRIV